MDALKINKKGWDRVAGDFFAATALPGYGPFTPAEKELKLFGDVRGKKILEIGCGSDHSLKYLH